MDNLVPGDIIISTEDIKYWEAEDDLTSIPKGAEFVYLRDVKRDNGLIAAKHGSAILHVKKSKFKKGNKMSLHDIVIHAQNIPRILNKSKTQHRIPMIPQPKGYDWTWNFMKSATVEDDYICPFTEIGSVISVFKKDGDIHMPSVTRTNIKLRIRDVNAEYLNEITEQEILKEGIWEDKRELYWAWLEDLDCLSDPDHDPFMAFIYYWDSIYGGTDFAWIKNPAVWVLDLELIGE